MAKRKLAETFRHFWDASAFVALLAKQDSRHNEALKIHRWLAQKDVQLYTSWPVISESATVLLYHDGYSSCLGLFKILSAFTLLRPNESDYFETIALFKEFNQDQKLSFNDILSYVLIRNHLPGASVVTFDKDFSKMGMTVFRP